MKANKKIDGFEAQLTELNNKINQGVSERKKLESDLESLTEENKALEESLKVVRNKLEEETVLRVDLENRNQSLNEQIEFQQKLYQKELEEVRIKEVKVSEHYSENLKQQYEARLNEEIDKIRADREERINYFRQELEEKYEELLAQIHDDLDRKNASLSSAEAKIKELNSRYTFMNSELEQIKSENINLKDKNNDLSKLIAQEREWNKAALARKQLETDEVKSKLDALYEDYKDLVDDKIKLDNELVVYRSLLEGEETRLNLSSPSRPPSAASPILTSTPSAPRSFVSRGNKRKRICTQEEDNLVDLDVVSNAKGDVEISEQDPEGKFVKIHNKGEKEVSLGGWILLQSADNLETRFKFHRSISIKPSGTVTVWSSDANAIHHPPKDIVMKGQTWFVGDLMTTSLINSNTEVRCCIYFLNLSTRFVFRRLPRVERKRNLYLVPINMHMDIILK